MKFGNIRIPTVRNLLFEFILLYGGLALMALLNVVMVRLDAVLLILAFPAWFVFHRLVHFVMARLKIDEY